MINLDEDDTIGAINELIGRENKRAMKKLVKVEIKSDKTELKIICICDYKIFLLSLNKNNKPNKIEQVIHFLEIKKIESPSSAHLYISTTDNKEYRIISHEIELSQIDCPSIDSTIDDILIYLFINFNEVFPSVSIKDLIENVNIEPEKRCQHILNEVEELKGRKSKLILCDNYSKAYMIFANLYSVNFYQEVAWDVNVIYGKNSLSEFSLNDFDYVNLKDAFPLISALRHNKWFDSFQSEGIKLTNEMQEELIKVLTLPNCHFKSISLVHSGLKLEFFHKMQIYLQSTGSKPSSNKPLIDGTFLPALRQVNFSKNSIEDRSLILFMNLYRDCSVLSTSSFTNHSRLTGLFLSKCSLTSKSINHMFSVLAFPSLTHLDLSFNHLKDDSTELFKFLSDPNELVELNFSSTDIDVEKLFMSLSKGGCDSKLKKLILNHNHTFSKSTNEHLGKYISRFVSLSQLELSNCRLSGANVQTILSNLKSNSNLGAQQISLNLSSNDLGSCLRQFAYEFSRINCINSLDLSDNNIENDSDLLIDQLRFTSILSLVLSKNFHSSKTKHSSRAIETLTKWLISPTTSLERLWLVDCKLKSSLNDLISELGEFSRLRLLDISGNEIGDFGLNLLSKSLQVNRSLETLIFDRSNISLAAYTHIIDSMKRNSSLKSIQIPINDVCVLYQKSPEKLVDLVKQMSELSVQRTSLLSTQQRLDLDQFFKTKMKLIDDSSTATTAATNSNGTLNTSLSSGSSNSILQSQPLSEDDLEESSTPSSVKQVLLGLNETARSFLTEKSVEKNFQKFNREILDKVDEYYNDLEHDLTESLRKKYPKHSVSHPNGALTNKDNADLNRLRNMINDYMSAMFVQMHNEICEMTYKISLNMADNLVMQANGQHPKGSFSGPTATSVPKAAHHDSNHSVASAVESLGKKIVGGIKLPFVSHSHTTPSLSTSSSSHHNTPMPATPLSSGETDLIETPAVVISTNNNSKSKRPISAQMYETTTTSTVSSSPVAQPHGVKTSLGSSSSNENIIESVTGSSDDDLDVVMSAGGHHLVNESSGKVSWREQGGGAAPPASSRAAVIEPGTSNAAPVPAPRKTKSIMKQFLGGLGAVINSNNAKTTTATSPSQQAPPAPSTSPSSTAKMSSITSPKVARKIETINEEIPTTLLPSSSVVCNETSSQVEEVKQLQHFNKDRPKRANVKKPTVKNPQAKIEIEAKMENLEEPEKTEPIVKPEEPTVVPTVTASSQMAQNLSIPSEDTVRVRQISPTGLKNPLAGAALAEQPKISQNALENVKLRSTVRYKPPMPQQPPSSNNVNDENSSSTRGIANRLSMFEQQKHELQLEKDKDKPLNQFMNIKLKKTSNENNNDLIEQSEDKEPIENAKSPSMSALRPITSINLLGSAKQTPPVPPNKPPRPAYNPPSNTPSFGINTKHLDDDDDFETEYITI